MICIYSPKTAENRHRILPAKVALTSLWTFLKFCVRSCATACALVTTSMFKLYLPQSIPYMKPLSNHIYMCHKIIFMSVRIRD